ncbi:MAG TPA: hypothetical protein PLQ97_07280 [Myxococcota bacterium]|nr:hypothetical protein [Myxococcota bacterium]HQK50436.1 hypothetical protein [Myxococcota bacterium]
MQPTSHRVDGPVVPMPPESPGKAAPELEVVRLEPPVEMTREFSAGA